jgi:hypothetical protein
VGWYFFLVLTQDGSSKIQARPKDLAFSALRDESCGQVAIASY